MNQSFTTSISRSIALAALAIVCLFSAYSPTRAAVIDVNAIQTWQQRLSEAKNASDSIKALYNLFDITHRADSGIYSYPLLQLTAREGEYGVHLDILRKIVNVNTNDSILVDSMFRMAQRVPESNDQRETLIFIELRRFYVQLQNMTEAERLSTLYNLVDQYRDDADAPLYERILPLYKLTMALGRTIGGNLYSEYMDRLQVLIRQLPDQFGPLSSFFYTQASVIYTITNDQEKAVEANKRYLNIVDTLKMRNRNRGHRHASYNSNEYVALRRMLVNYEALTPWEVEHYYRRLMALVESDQQLATEYSNVARARSYYLVAKQRYPEAIEALHQAIENEKNGDYRTRMLRLLVECAKQTGNRDELRAARDEYVINLEKTNERRQREKLAELRFLMDINSNVRERFNNLEVEHEKLLNEYYKDLLVMSIIAGVAVLAFAIMMTLYFRRRQ